MPRKPLLTLDQKIEQAEDNVRRMKQRYDAAVAELSELREQRDEEKCQELFSALSRSQRSYEEILAFIRSVPQSDASESPKADCD